MYTMMYLQKSYYPERFISHITVIRTLPSMYAIMYFQMCY